jgi:hypothetical protein
LFPAIGRWGGATSEKPIGDHQLAKIVKRLAAGLDPQACSHSLRSGLATAAAASSATTPPEAVCRSSITEIDNYGYRR